MMPAASNAILYNVYAAVGGCGRCNAWTTSSHRRQEDCHACSFSPPARALVPALPWPQQISGELYAVGSSPSLPLPCDCRGQETDWGRPGQRLEHGKRAWWHEARATDSKQAHGESTRSTTMRTAHTRKAYHSHGRMVEGFIVSSSIAPTRLRPPRWTFPVLLLALPLIGVLLFVFPPWTQPQATILIHPLSVEKHDLLHLTSTVAPTDASQSQPRRLSATAVSPQLSVQATGVVQQQASVARGTLTFYNLASFPQTIAEGLVFIASQGIQIVTDQTVTIQPGVSPAAGSASVSAHARQAGVLGNVGPLTIHGPCSPCGGTALAVKNLRPFLGGQDAQTFTVVTQANLDNVAHGHAPELVNQSQIVLGRQLHQGEQVGTPIGCTEHLTSEPGVGAKATLVSVEITETCTALAFDPQGIGHRAATLFRSQVERSLDAHLTLAGPITTHIQAAVVERTPDTLSISVQVAGRWVYQLSPTAQSRLIQQLEGLPCEQALAFLSAAPGIKQASIEGIGKNDLLPRDPARLTIEMIL